MQWERDDFGTADTEDDAHGEAVHDCRSCCTRYRAGARTAKRGSDRVFAAAETEPTAAEESRLQQSVAGLEDRLVFSARLATAWDVLVLGRSHLKVHASPHRGEESQQLVRCLKFSRREACRD